MTAIASPPSSRASSAWRNAAAHSRLWRALGPLRRAWMGAERRVARPSLPTQTDGDDRRMEETVRDSWLFRAADRALDDVTRSWSQSACVGRGRVLTDQWRRLAPVRRVRVAAGLALSAAATVLLIRLLLLPEPLSWLVPAAVAIAALLAMVCSRGLVAAWIERR